MYSTVQCPIHLVRCRTSSERRTQSYNLILNVFRKFKYSETHKTVKLEDVIHSILLKFDVALIKGIVLPIA